MAARDGDTALWLHNKLGSTDDLWSGSSICSQLTREKLRNIQECFYNLQPYVKVKLMLAFLHLPKRNVEEWRQELAYILQLAQDDPDQWVAMVGDLLRTFPNHGTLNTQTDSQHRFFHEVITDLKKLVKKSSDAGMIPLECLFLSRLAFTSVVGQQQLPVKHFALKRKPKSAALRAELLQKSVEAANNLRKNATTTSLPFKVRSFAKKQNDTTPMKGLPSHTPSSGGFLRSNSLASRSFGGSGTPLRSRKEGGIKLLDIAEMPVGAKEAKRRRKIQEMETAEQAKKEKEAQANATPDYAAGLVSSAISNISVVSVPEEDAGLPAGPSYAPSTVSRLPAVVTTTLPTSVVSIATQQARENLHQQLTSQLIPTIPGSTATTTPPTAVRIQMVSPASVSGAAAPGSLITTQQVMPQHVVAGTTMIISQSGPQPAQPVTPVVANSAGQPAPKQDLTLTKEQFYEAKDMFKTSNKLTRPEKAIILGFMAGQRRNPCPQNGDTVNIRLSEHKETILQPDGTFRPMIEDTFFQMNYATGEWKRIKKYRDIEVEED